MFAADEPYKCSSPIQRLSHFLLENSNRAKVSGRLVYTGAKIAFIMILCLSQDVQCTLYCCPTLTMPRQRCLEMREPAVTYPLVNIHNLLSQVLTNLTINHQSGQTGLIWIYRAPLWQPPSVNVKQLRI